jgi:hypothetical protein
MNIKFKYLYRDGANYKRYGEVVFANPSEVFLADVFTVLQSNLIDKQWFVASHWGLPDMHFREYDWNESIDHDWHEFEDVEETTDSATEKKSISEFLLFVEQKR